MGSIARNTVSIEQERIRDPDGIGSECSKEKFRIVEIIKIVYRIACTKTDSLDFLKVDIIDSLDRKSVV